jgi:hypothetical protein
VRAASSGGDAVWDLLCEERVEAVDDVTLLDAEDARRYALLETDSHLSKVAGQKTRRQLEDARHAASGDGTEQQWDASLIVVVCRKIPSAVVRGESGLQRLPDGRHVGPPGPPL